MKRTTAALYLGVGTIEPDLLNNLVKSFVTIFEWAASGIAVGYPDVVRLPANSRGTCGKRWEVTSVSRERGTGCTPRQIINAFLCRITFILYIIATGNCGVGYCASSGTEGAWECSSLPPQHCVKCLPGAGDRRRDWRLYFSWFWSLALIAAKLSLRFCAIQQLRPYPAKNANEDKLLQYSPANSMMLRLG